jgi:hypothetical protein
MFELKRVLLEQLFSLFHAHRNSAHLKMRAFDQAEIVTCENLSNEFDSKDGYVASDPIAIILYGGINRGPAAAKRIEYYIALVRRGLNDPIQKGDWLLRRIAQTFR